MHVLTRSRSRSVQNAAVHKARELPGLSTGVLQRTALRTCAQAVHARPLRASQWYRPFFRKPAVAAVLAMRRIRQRSRRIRLSTSSRNGHIRERLEVLRLVAGDDAYKA